MKKRISRRGQGEVLTTLLLAELIVVLLVFASWYMIVKDKQKLLQHTDLDQELTQDALHTLPAGMTVEGENVLSLPSHSEDLFKDVQK